MPKTMSQLLVKVGDSSIPIAHRSSMLIDVLAEAQGGEAQAQAIAQEVFNRLVNQACDEVAKKRSETLKQILEQLENVPLRPATFIQLSKVNGPGKIPHALVSLDNGELAFVVVHDHDIVSKLALGERVLLDGQGKILVHPIGSEVHTGTESRFERQVDERHIEVINNQDERRVVLAVDQVMDKIRAREVVNGSPVVIGPCGRLAIHALPPADKGADNFRFLDRGLVPDVVVERDIGSPPAVIGQVAKHIREEMTRPELRRRFKLRPCITRLLAGVSGTGKTLAVQAIHRQMYEIMSEVTGTPLDQLPARVFRFRNSQMLSMWLGESDKNADRLFDEVEKVAAQPYVKDGKEIKLPVLVVMEEADGMGRARGEEAIYDRILTTILQRLDPNRRGLSDQLVVFLSTTNEPHIVDPALLRRIGGAIEVFGRLDQAGFTEVLRKHVSGLPAGNGHTKNQAKAWKSIIADINDWLFVEGVDKGVVELSFQGHHAGSVKYHRDFLTGALVDRAVQQAATEAWEASITNPKSGITMEQLLHAIRHQVASIAYQLTPMNVGHYIDIPEGVRVVNVRSLLQKTP